jgi:hypothetical protein
MVLRCKTCRATTNVLDCVSENETGFASKTCACCERRLLAEAFEDPFRRHTVRCRACSSSPEASRFWRRREDRAAARAVGVIAAQHARHRAILGAVAAVMGPPPSPPRRQRVRWRRRRPSKREKQRRASERVGGVVAVVDQPRNTTN